MKESDKIREKKICDNLDDDKKEGLKNVNNKKKKRKTWQPLHS